MKTEDQAITTAIPNKGFSGFRAVLPTSGFVSVDSFALRIPLPGIAANRCVEFGETKNMKH